jgi:ABC-type glycerol-3-phosphate transport system permease component
MWKDFRKDLPSHSFLIAAALVALYPFIYMIMTSFKNNAEFYHNYFGISLPLHFDNYVVAWQAISPYLLNSALFAASGVIIMALTGSLAGYSFARLRYRGKPVIFMAVIALLMIPGLLTLIPLFLEMKGLGLLNSRIGMILAFAAGGQAFTIFVFRQSIASLPEELFEAARIDGYSEVRVYLNIVLPLSKPIIGTVSIFNLLSIWNNYLLPLVLINSQSKYPLTVGLMAFRGQFVYNAQYGPMFAGYTIASLPLLILFLFTMRLFMRGLTAGSIKM